MENQQIPQKNLLRSTLCFKIRFSEIDAMRVVWHGDYVKYFEDAREYFGEMYLRSDMNRSRAGTFEGLNVRIPNGTEAYMKVLYGDTYMNIPPESEREIHSAVELKF